MEAEAVFGLLAASLPPAVLLLGQGSWELGERLWQVHGSPYGLVIPRLDARAAQEVCEAAWVLPPAGFKVFLLRLDRSSRPAQDYLLKTLEEPPATVRMLLAASTPPLPTVLSRCQVFSLGSPPPAGPDERTARVQASVGVAVRAARDGHAPVLEAVLHGWEPAHAAQLRAWAAEAASGRWSAFGQDFAPGVSVRQALTVLSVLSSYEGARTAPAVALERAFRP